MANPKLFKTKEKAYGKQYKEHLFEQYRLYIESAEKISERRQNAINHFITINAVLVTLLSLSFKVRPLQMDGWMKTVLSLIGVFICIIFWVLVRSYKQLNTGKFKIIHMIEQELPLALYDYEWEILENGENTKVYFPFSHVELYLPWTFAFIYLLVGVIYLFS